VKVNHFKWTDALLKYNKYKQKIPHNYVYEANYIDKYLKANNNKINIKKDAVPQSSKT